MRSAARRGKVLTLSRSLQSADGSSAQEPAHVSAGSGRDCERIPVRAPRSRSARSGAFFCFVSAAVAEAGRLLLQPRSACRPRRCRQAHRAYVIARVRLRLDTREACFLASQSPSTLCRSEILAGTRARVCLAAYPARVRCSACDCSASCRNRCLLSPTPGFDAAHAC